MPFTRRRFFQAVGSGFLAGPATVGVLRAEGAHAVRPMDQMAIQLAQVDEEHALDMTMAFLEEGADWRDLLGAVLLAGAREIRPRPVGFKLHALMVVGSIYDLAYPAAPKDRPAALMFAVKDLKHSQKRDISHGDWQLPPKPRASQSNPSAAKQTLREALEAWRDEAADRALVSLFPHTNRDELFSLLWPYAIRDFHNIGHKPIFTVQLYRSLNEIPWSHSLPILRSLVHGLLAGGPGATTADFMPNQALAELPSGRRTAGKIDTSVSLELKKILQTANPRDAGKEIIKQLKAGISEASLWDGIHLFAADVLWRKPGLLPVHPATCANALHTIYRITDDQHLRRTLLLQAASWMTRYRRELGRMVGLEMEGAGIERLVPHKGKEVDVAQIARIVTQSPEEAATLLLQHTMRQPTAHEWTALQRRLLFYKGRESHQFKYAAAVHAQFSEVHPRWRGHVLAAGLAYLPKQTDAHNAVYRRLKASMR